MPPDNTTPVEVRSPQVVRTVVQTVAVLSFLPVLTLCILSVLSAYGLKPAAEGPAMLKDLALLAIGSLSSMLVSTRTKPDADK